MDLRTVAEARVKFVGNVDQPNKSEVQETIDCAQETTTKSSNFLGENQPGKVNL
jgi:hypothetical protein